jgi:2-amino-4-hydroxy-6-hydroxymethyldihydropteridine diphosphokinase
VSAPFDRAHWAQFMDAIRKDMGYTRAADEAAAHDLERILRTRKDAAVLETATRLVAKDHVLVLGAADTALEDVRHASKSHTLIAADGATSAAREARRVPDLITTDLDGNVEDQIWAAEHGALVIVHAHGDNRQAIATWLPRFPAGQVAGSCQVDAFGRLINPGGFTDGDRACFLARALGAATVTLLGFDLAGPPGRFTGHYNPATKARKLAWAARCLRYARDELGLVFDPPLEDVSDSTQAT